MTNNLRSFLLPSQRHWLLRLILQRSMPWKNSLLGIRMQGAGVWVFRLFLTEGRKFRRGIQIVSAPPTATRPAALASVPTPPPPFTTIAAFEPSARAPAAAALRVIDASQKLNTNLLAFSVEKLSAERHHQHPLISVEPYLRIVPNFSSPIRKVSCKRNKMLKQCEGPKAWACCWRLQGEQEADTDKGFNWLVHTLEDSYAYGLALVSTCSYMTRNASSLGRCRSSSFPSRWRCSRHAVRSKPARLPDGLACNQLYDQIIP